MTIVRMMVRVMVMVMVSELATGHPGNQDSGNIYYRSHIIQYMLILPSNSRYEKTGLEIMITGMFFDDNDDVFDVVYEGFSKRLVVRMKCCMANIICLFLQSGNSLSK